MFSVLFAVAVVSVAVIDASNEKVLSALPIGALNAQDRQHLINVFQDYNRESLKEMHYALHGNSAFGLNFVDGLSCESVKLHFDASDPETQYYALSAAAASGIESCKPKVAFPNRLKDALKNSDLTVERLYFLVSSANIASVRLDKEPLLKLLGDFAAKETGPSSLSAILATAAMINNVTTQELEPFSPLVAKLVEQADEADGNTLFFERGAYTTAFAVESIFKFAKSFKRLPSLTEEQVIKFGNFLYKRRRSNQIRTAALVASALKILATNAFVSPVVVYGMTESERAGVSGILVTHSRRLYLRLLDIFGTQLNTLMTVRAGPLYSKGELAPTNLGEFRLDRSIDAFELNLDELAGPIPRGHYTLEITVFPAKNETFSSLLAGVTKAQVPLRVVSPLKVEKAHIKLSDSAKTLVDSALAAPWGRHPEVLVLHHSSRLHLSFSLEDAVVADTNSPPPQQVFVQLTHATGHRSVTLITKRSTIDASYVCTLSLDAVGENFDRVSGVYKVDVLVGDSLVESPIVWHVADVDLRFPQNGDFSASSQLNAAVGEDDDVARLTVASSTARKRPIHPLVGNLPSTHKPQLEHTFSTPEPRPSDLLAFTFTALCCAPLVALLCVWPMMGANLFDFSFNFSALFFHLGLGGIFGLYLAYWFKLNMFETLRYLLFLGIVTFVAGNRLLRLLISGRNKSPQT